MNQARRIGLFGGTFDPVHLGHIHIAAAACDALSLDEVRFIPCRVSPHKTGHPPTDSADRFEMLRIATRQLSWAVVDDCEIQREGPSYSWKTAEEMTARFPDADLFWIMGVDQWNALPKWAHPERLASLVAFIVISRGTKPTPREGYTMHHLETTHPASATTIREEIGAGNKSHPWLHPDVAAWIVKHGLYRG